MQGRGRGKERVCVRGREREREREEEIEQRVETGKFSRYPVYAVQLRATREFCILQPSSRILFPIILFNNLFTDFTNFSSLRYRGRIFFKNYERGRVRGK